MKILNRKRKIVWFYKYADGDSFRIELIHKPKRLIDMRECYTIQPGECYEVV